VAAYQFAGVPDAERLAAAFLAQSRPLRIRVVKEDPPDGGSRFGAGPPGAGLMDSLLS